MQDLSSGSVNESGGAVASQGNEAATGEAIAETGQRLWYQLIALAAVAVLSFSLLISHLVAAQNNVRALQTERGRAEAELGVAKGQLEAMASELAAAKAKRAEQIIATDKEVKRSESELAALKTQRAVLAAQIDELGKRQQEADHRLALSTQRRSEVESQLATLREELANKRHRPRKPASNSGNTP